ncbi:MAG: hypothetical protein QME51_09665 [Planctomycetota bacterium]|nr:hypothetical protein [Planctomycetota bacterium]
MIKLSEEQWAILRQKAEAVFRAKLNRRRTSARRPMAEKIKEVISLQRIARKLDLSYPCWEK